MQGGDGEGDGRVDKDGEVLKMVERSSLRPMEGPLPGAGGASRP